MSWPRRRVFYYPRGWDTHARDWITICTLYVRISSLSNSELDSHIGYGTLPNSPRLEFQLRATPVLKSPPMFWYSPIEFSRFTRHSQIPFGTSSAVNRSRYENGNVCRSSREIQLRLLHCVLATLACEETLLEGTTKTVETICFTFLSSQLRHISVLYLFTFALQNKRFYISEIPIWKYVRFRLWPQYFQNWDLISAKWLPRVPKAFNSAEKHGLSRFVLAISCFAGHTLRNAASRAEFADSPAYDLNYICRGSRERFPPGVTSISNDDEISLLICMNISVGIFQPRSSYVDDESSSHEKRPAWWMPASFGNKLISMCVRFKAVCAVLKRVGVTKYRTF